MASVIITGSVRLTASASVVVINACITSAHAQLLHVYVDLKCHAGDIICQIVLFPACMHVIKEELGTRLQNFAADLL